MSTIAERVAAGAAFLDIHDPDWWRADVERAIDLDTLRLSAPHSCILGQRCPVETLERYVLARYGEPLSAVEDPEDWNYWALAAELSGIPAGQEGDSSHPVVDWSIPLGFNSRSHEYADLTAEWRKVITGRRSAS